MPYEPRRDFIGYGNTPPAAQWPGGAKLALNFVINYEEGAEYSIDEGDGVSEAILSDLASRRPCRACATATWNRLRLRLAGRGLAAAVAVWRQAGGADLLCRRARAGAEPACRQGRSRDSGSDIVCHGWRWIDYAPLSEDEERRHIAMTVDTVQSLTGITPLGWYTGRPSLNTRRLVVEHGGFLFDCDDYNEDLPYFVDVDGKRHLVVPHSFDNNDSRFSRGSGLETGGQFYDYVGDAVDWLLAEGERAPKMMTVSLHCRLAARPGRMMGLARFLDKVKANPDIWICRRTDIAKHWLERFGG